MMERASMAGQSDGPNPSREVVEALKLLKANRGIARAGSGKVVARVQIARAATLIEADLKRRGQLK